MISISKIKKLLLNPSLLVGRLRWTGLRMNMEYNKRIGDRDGVAIMEEDWDNLIILDGCRYDIFSDRNRIDGELRSKTSLGSASKEFIEQNFVGNEFHDTVYVTCNPFVTRIEDGTFHTVVNLLDEWDSELQTVHPEVVVDTAKQVHAEHPDKRLIIHFMQPHYPFIGQKGRSIDHKGYSKGEDNNLSGKNVWGQLRINSDELSIDEVWEAYRENLDIVLSHVEELLKELTGRSVITADHGNLIGERLRPVPVRGYGHPPRIRVPELVTVPWHVIDAESRREITADPPLTHEKPSDETVTERLRALGYRE